MWWLWITEPTRASIAVWGSADRLSSSPDGTTAGDSAASVFTAFSPEIETQKTPREMCLSVAV
jgi:hypothetical protein